MQVFWSKISFLQDRCLWLPCVPHWRRSRPRSLVQMLPRPRSIRRHRLLCDPGSPGSALCRVYGICSNRPPAIPRHFTNLHQALARASMTHAMLQHPCPGQCRNTFKCGAAAFPFCSLPSDSEKNVATSPTWSRRNVVIAASSATELPSLRPTLIATKRDTNDDSPAACCGRCQKAPAFP